MTSEVDSDADAQDEVIHRANSPTVDTSDWETPSDESSEPADDDSSEGENNEDVDLNGNQLRLRELLWKMAASEGPISDDSLHLRLCRLINVNKLHIDAILDDDGQTALHLAARYGLFDAAKELINVKANISAIDKVQRQPLHQACSQGHTNLAKLLLDNEANVDAKQYHQATPLHEACTRGHIDVVKLLLERKSNTQVIDELGQSPLYLASRHGHKEVVSCLLEADDSNINGASNTSRTPLHTATYHGHTEVVSILLKKGAAIGATDNKDWTPLMMATSHKHAEIMKMLLTRRSKDADIQLETCEKKQGRSPLLWASMHGFLDGVRQLIDAGANCNATTHRSGATPLTTAVVFRHREIVEALLEANADVNIQLYYDRQTALHSASRENHVKIVQLLLFKSDPNINGSEENGRTALHLASNNGNERVVRLLLDANARVDAADNDGKTALHLASGARDTDRSENNSNKLGSDDLTPEESRDPQFQSGRHGAVLHLLLDNGANPGTKTNENKTALHLAAEHGDPGRLQILLQRMNKDQVLAQDNDGRTALYSAFKGDKRQAAMRCLLKSDMLEASDFGRRDMNVKALEWAAKSSKTHDIAKWLFQKRLKRVAAGPPPGSDNWSTIQWAAHEQLPRVLSLIISNSPKTEETYKALKSALMSTLELVKRLHEGTAGKHLPQILSLLIVSSPVTDETDRALKSALESTLRLRGPLQEGVLSEHLPPVLWLLVTATDRNSQIDGALSSALKLVKEVRGQSQSLSPVQESWSQPQAAAVHKLHDISTSDTVVPHHQIKNKSQERDKNKARTRQNEIRTEFKETGAGGVQLNDLEIIQDILEDPPFAQMHKDRQQKLPQPKEGAECSLQTFKATVVRFYKEQNESGTIRRRKPVQEVIYESGPNKIMETAVSNLKRIIGNDARLTGHVVDLKNEHRFTWVHLPSTNMDWMNDLLEKIMNDMDEGYNDEVRSFFQDSWTEVPDRESASRIMRPRTAVRKQQQDTRPEKATKPQKATESQKATKSEKASKSEKVAGRTRRHGKKTQEAPYPVATSAIYMPYVSLSSYFPVDAFPSLDENQTRIKRIKNDYGALLKAYEDSVIHGSPTLDEWYYHFDTSHESTLDRLHRNKTQVVTKFLEGHNSSSSRPNQLTLLRVDQLWVWTIGTSWIITATSCMFDESHQQNLVEEIVGHLSKRAESEGSTSQPESAAEMSKLIVDYCIGSYERRPKHHCEVSIGQIFSNYLNKIGRDEAALFEDFSGQKQTRNQQEQGHEDKNMTHDSSPGKRSSKTQSEASLDTSVRTSTSDQIAGAIKKAQKLYCDIKDVRDELNILKSVAQYQRTVQERLHVSLGQVEDTNLLAAYVVKDILQMEAVANRIQSAVNTTLSLQQTAMSLHQGKVVVIFTFATLLFLPLSFLSSLFALDVASFQQTPGWAFVVIFLVSVTISCTLVLCVIYLDIIKSTFESWWSNVRKRFTQAEPKEEDSQAAGKGESRASGKEESRAARVRDDGLHNVPQMRRVVTHPPEDLEGQRTASQR